METLEYKVLSRIYGNGRGWAFSQNDFADIGTRSTIDSALSRLEKKGTIMKIMRGIYCYPHESSILNKKIPADVPKVAQALARKFGWKIFPTGEIALNYFGLSTQIPAKYVYITNGVSRSYKVSNQELRFRKLLKESAFKHHESAILVQAIRALGKEYLTKDNFEKIREKIPATKYSLILKDTMGVAGWMYEAIREICK